MISKEQIEESVALAPIGAISVTDEDVAEWAFQSGARLASNDNYLCKAEPETVQNVLVAFLSWCAAHQVDPAYDDEAAIPAMERLLGLSGLHPALMTEALALSDQICATLPEGFREADWDDGANVASLAIGF
jgi:hypothetical protein